MRYKVSLFAFALFTLLLLALSAFCQDHKSQHKDRFEWEENIGLKFVTITSKDDSLVYFYQLSKFEQKLSSLAYDSNTHFQKDDATKPYKATGCHAIHYCRVHLIIYIAQRVPCFDESPTQLTNSNSAKNPQ